VFTFRRGLSIAINVDTSVSQIFCPPQKYNQISPTNVNARLYYRTRL